MRSIVMYVLLAHLSLPYEFHLLSPRDAIRATEVLTLYIHNVVFSGKH
jgi:hypothetical protein